MVLAGTCLALELLDQDCTDTKLQNVQEGMYKFYSHGTYLPSFDIT